MRPGSLITTIATVSEENGTITIKALQKGTTTITIKDTQTNEVKEISVKIVEKLSIGRKSLTITQGSENTTSIYSGEPTIFTSADPTIATARVGESDGEKFVFVRGLKPGNTTIEVSDGDTSYTIRVEVKKVPDLAFVDSGNTRNLSVGDNIDVTITGSGQFKLANSDDSVATAVLDENSFENNWYNIAVRAIKTGTTKVTITDTISEQTITLTINVK